MENLNDYTKRILNENLLSFSQNLNFEKKIEPFEFFENPKNLMSEEGINIIAFHRKYNLGNNNDYSSSDFNSLLEVKKQLEKDFGKNALILPLSVYEHGNIIVYAGVPTCKWDSGALGFVVIEAKKIAEFYGKKIATLQAKNKMASYIDSMLENYTRYLNGEPEGYEFTIKLNGIPIIEDWEENETDAKKTVVDYIDSIKEYLNR